MRLAEPILTTKLYKPQSLAPLLDTYYKTSPQLVITSTPPKTNKLQPNCLFPTCSISILMEVLMNWMLKKKKNMPAKIQLLLSLTLALTVMLV